MTAQTEQVVKFKFVSLFQILFLINYKFLRSIVVLHTNKSHMVLVIYQSHISVNAIGGESL